MGILYRITQPIATSPSQTLTAKPLDPEESIKRWAISIDGYGNLTGEFAEDFRGALRALASLSIIPQIGQLF